MDASALHGKMAIFVCEIPRQVFLYYTPILTGVLDSLSESQVKCCKTWLLAGLSA